MEQARLRADECAEVAWCEVGDVVQEKTFVDELPMPVGFVSKHGIVYSLPMISHDVPCDFRIPETGVQSQLSSPGSAVHLRSIGVSARDATSRIKRVRVPTEG